MINKIVLVVSFFFLFQSWKVVLRLSIDVQYSVDFNHLLHITSAIKLPRHALWFGHTCSTIPINLVVTFSYICNSIEHVLYVLCLCLWHHYILKSKMVTKSSWLNSELFPKFFQQKNYYSTQYYMTICIREFGDKYAQRNWCLKSPGDWSFQYG